MTATEPLVSIIVPAWNEEKDIGAARGRCFAFIEGDCAAPAEWLAGRSLGLVRELVRSAGVGRRRAGNGEGR